MRVRKANERGHFKNEWLDSFHSFSFADYFDPNHMNFQDLRVINEDVIEPDSGFPMHGHRDMEIITYVTEGAVAHKDSMGNTEQLKAGEVQVMSAGKGVLHSEFNPSSDQRLKLLQIWVVPSRQGLTPGYQQKEFSPSEKQNQFKLLVSPDGANDSLKMNQDARLFASVLDEGKTLNFEVTKGRSAWIQVVSGQIEVNGHRLNEGDALASDDGEGALMFKSVIKTEFLLFDLVTRK